jgi:hypothetical protein
MKRGTVHRPKRPSRRGSTWHRCTLTARIAGFLPSLTVSSARCRGDADSAKASTCRARTRSRTVDRVHGIRLRPATRPGLRCAPNSSSGGGPWARRPPRLGDSNAPVWLAGHLRGRFRPAISKPGARALETKGAAAAASNLPTRGWPVRAFSARLQDATASYSRVATPLNATLPIGLCSAQDHS